MTKVLVSGSTGFIGRALTTFLTAQNQEVFKLSRESTEPNTIAWNIDQQELNINQIENFESFIHLAGENILGLWTKEKKRKIYQSRIEGTKLLVDRILHLKHPPKNFICASAVGIYGSKITTPATEESLLGNDFLANLCKDWEIACQPLTEAGIRVVNLRIGVVIDPNGGMLKQMLLPFKLGLGAWLGNGQQNLAWIGRDDLIQIINFCLNHQEISGPVNAVAPEMINNKQFSHAIAKHLRRPCFLKIPEIILQIFLGQDLATMILSDQKIIPNKLQKNGYKFLTPTIETLFQLRLIN